MRIQSSLVLVLVVIAVMLASPARATNIVVNGGFESSTIGPWVINTGIGPTLSDNTTPNPNYDTPWGCWGQGPYPFNTPCNAGFDLSSPKIGPQAGTNFVQTGCDQDPTNHACIAPDSNPLGNWLYQDLSTTPGSLYDLTFWYAPGAAAGPNDPNVELQVLWGATAVPLIASAPGTCAPGTNCVFDNTSSGSFTYTEYTIDNLVATSGSTRLEFLAEQDPGYNGLDNVDVEATDPAPVPEPASLTLLGTGIAGLVIRRRRNKQAR